MEFKGIERRSCIRFEIPGATVSYKKKSLLPAKEAYAEEFCPVLDMSRGGIRFLSQKSIKVDSNIILKIAIPGEKIPLIQKGRVRWASFNVGQSYKYQIGVQFNVYGEKKDQNLVGNLTKIIALEQKFAPQEEAASKDTEEFDIEG